MTREGVQVGLNDESVVDFTLDPRVTDSVTVTGDAPPINLTRSQVTSSLTAEQIMDKPSLNAGNFLSLAETFPGLQENPTGGQNNPTASSGSSINFNNTGTRGATFQINGVNNDDSSENQNRQGVALSTIQEFQILKNGYSSEFGRGDGAAVAADAQCAGAGFFGIALTAACPVAVPIANNEISARVPRTNERRPDPLYTTNLLISNDAESWYDGIEFSWDKRLSHGIQFQVAYTYSNSEDTTSEATFVGAGDSNQQGPNSRYARAKSRFHTPHRFTLNGSYRLPFFANSTGFAGQAFGGWMLSGVVRVISGTPFTVTATGVDIDFDGFAESRPVLLDPSVVGARVDDRATAQTLLPLAAFRPVTFGDTIDDLVPRNAFYGDGLRNVDLALSKFFRLPWSGDDLSVRIEGFNVFNQVQFGFPVTDINSTTFGALNSLATGYSPRVVQFVMRYRY